MLQIDSKFCKRSILQNINFAKDQNKDWSKQENLHILGKVEIIHISRKSFRYIKSAQKSHSREKAFSDAVQQNSFSLPLEKVSVGFLWNSGFLEKGNRIMIIMILIMIKGR